MERRSHRQSHMKRERHTRSIGNSQWHVGNFHADMNTLYNLKCSGEPFFRPGCGPKQPSGMALSGNYQDQAVEKKENRLRNHQRELTGEAARDANHCDGRNSGEMSEILNEQCVQHVSHCGDSQLRSCHDRHQGLPSPSRSDAVPEVREVVDSSGTGSSTNSGCYLSGCMSSFGTMSQFGVPSLL